MLKYLLKDSVDDSNILSVLHDPYPVKAKVQQALEGGPPDPLSLQGLPWTIGSKGVQLESFRNTKSGGTHMRNTRRVALFCARGHHGLATGSESSPIRRCKSRGRRSTLAT